MHALQNPSAVLMLALKREPPSLYVAVVVGRYDNDLAIIDNTSKRIAQLIEALAIQLRAFV
jgi:hypothetical protein